MDNITHTLLGIAAAETLAAGRRKARGPLWVASAVANNLPDLDLVLTKFFYPDKLGYLLHHRGHTHTVLLAPLQSLLFLLLLRFCWRKRTDIPWPETVFLAFLGPLLHLFADSWNSYGVHPFWPWNNRWFYGDLVFILEPWIWVILLPLCGQLAHYLASRWLAWLLHAGILWAAWTNSALPWPAALALTGFSAAWLAWQPRITEPRWRIGCALVFLVALFALFQTAQLRLQKRFASHNGELAVQPFPGNPFCWLAFRAGFVGDLYLAKVSTEAAWPDLVPVSQCPAFFRAGSAIGLPPSKEAASSASQPLVEFSGTRAALQAIAQDCGGAAFLRFARIPFWQPQGTSLIVGDLRFARTDTTNFASLLLTAETSLACPRHVPPWIGRFLPGGH